MDLVLTDLLTKKWWAWAALAISLASVVLLFREGFPATPLAGWMSIVGFLALCVFFAPSINRAAHLDHKHLMTVCVWTFALVILFIVVAYFAFFCFVGGKAEQYERLLNIVPVFVGIWGAAVGWLIHFRITSKVQKTNNAFAMLMETRKSSEFLRKSELVTKHFPPGTTSIPAEYHDYFPSDSLRKLYVEAGDGDPDPKKLEMAQAVLALTYVLNYYEFIAVAIRFRDLDEELIYNTISPHIMGVVKRSKALIEHSQKAHDDKTILEDVCKLAEEWKGKPFASNKGPPQNRRRTDP